MANDNKLPIGLKEIKNILVARLARTPFEYKIFLSEGEYVKAVKRQNRTQGKINAILNNESTDIMVLGGGIKAVSLISSITFLVPINDDSDGEENTYRIEEEFKEGLSGIFPVSEVIPVTVNGATYACIFSGGYPTPGMLMQRQYIGKSIEYTCTFEISYLQNSINSSSVTFYCGDNTNALPVTSFHFSRKSTVLATPHSNQKNCEAQAYAESSSFGVDLVLPALSPSLSLSGEMFYTYLKGSNSENLPVSENSPVRLRISLKEDIDGVEVYSTIEKEMIIGEVAYEGGGIDNMSMRVSFIPYIAAEDVEGV